MCINWCILYTDNTVHGNRRGAGVTCVPVCMRGFNPKQPFDFQWGSSNVGAMCALEVLIYMTIITLLAHV